MLAAVVASRQIDADGAAEAAGRAWGASAAAEQAEDQWAAPRPSLTHPHRPLGDLGVEPELRTDELRLHRCPSADVGGRHQGVVGTVAAALPLLGEVEGLASRVGRRFQVLAWLAYAVLIATGIGNVLLLRFTWSTLTHTPAGRVLVDKLGLVVISGAAAALHALVIAPRQPRLSRRVFSSSAAILGSVSLLAALGAALYGVVIAQGTA